MCYMPTALSGCSTNRDIHWLTAAANGADEVNECSLKAFSHSWNSTDRQNWKICNFFSFRQGAFIVPTPNMSGRYNALSRRRGNPAKRLQSDHLDLRKCDLTKSFEQPKERECRNSPQEKTKSQSFSHRSVWQPGLTSKCALGLSVHSPKRSSFTIMALKLWDAYLLLCLFYCPAAMSRDCRVSVCETQ